MKITKQYLRRIIREQLKHEEEVPELSELDKIKEIFEVNGAQAVELGEMLLPDAPEIRMMKRTVKKVREFLELFEKPASNYDQRLRARNTFYYDMGRTLLIALPDPVQKGYRGKGPVTTMYHNLGRMYKDLEGIIGFKKLEDWLPDIEAAAEWAGVPAPQIPKEWPLK